jgi:hypothetical protein
LIVAGRLQAFRLGEILIRRHQERFIRRASRPVPLLLSASCATTREGRRSRRSGQARRRRRWDQEHPEHRSRGLNLPRL